MIHKIYIHDAEDAESLSHDVYAFSTYSSVSNMNLARTVERPEKYPAILVFNWDEKGDIHSLDYEYVYLTDFSKV